MHSSQLCLLMLWSWLPYKETYRHILAFPPKQSRALHTYMYIMCRRTREDLKAANKRITTMLADYGDVVPRRDYEGLERSFQTLEGEHEQLKNDHFTLMEEHRWAPCGCGCMYICSVSQCVHAHDVCVHMCVRVYVCSLSQCVHVCACGMSSVNAIGSKHYCLLVRSALTEGPLNITVAHCRPCIARSLRRKPFWRRTFSL